MIHRPLDEAGDILPVLSSGDLLRGTEAVVALVRERLNLLTGDWWENPTWGNEALDMLQESRLTEEESQTLASYLSSYIRETPGVRDVREISCGMEGRQVRFSCTVETESGSARVHYEL